MPSGLHVWEMFIRPEEIKSLLEQNELIWKEHIGIRPSVSVLKVLRYLRKRAEGKLTYEEFGEKFQMSQSEKINIMYMGYALKKNYRNRVLFYT
jgi:2-polyprenyl-6-hydroxyphenyl methylase/3-demethylubiquinone-9 3-methyltransferase